MMSFVRGEYREPIWSSQSVSGCGAVSYYRGLLGKPIGDIDISISSFEKNTWAHNIEMRRRPDGNHRYEFCRLGFPFVMKIERIDTRRIILHWNRAPGRHFLQVSYAYEDYMDLRPGELGSLWKDGF